MIKAPFADPSLNQRRTLLRMLAVIIGVIFIAEVAVMLLLPLISWSGFGPIEEALLDSAGLAILSAPIIWWGVVRPLQATLASEQARFRDLIDGAPDGILGCDPAGRIVFANPRIEELFGYPRAELIGSAVEVLIPERFRENHPLSRESYLGAPTTRLMGSGQELVGLRADGTEFPAEIGLSTSKTKIGTTIIAIVRDVSGRKKIEQDLRDANETLRLWLAELERRHRQTIVINEMGDLLQSCMTADEVWKVMGGFAERIFPDSRGAAYKLDRSGEVAERFAAWGETPHPSFHIERSSCWALRRGRLHCSGPPESALVCRHVAPQPVAGCVCVPILARGETSGLMLVTLGEDEYGTPHSAQCLEAVVVNVAERVGLAMANVELQKTLREQSIRDSLTGLYNRHYMDKSLERELSQSRESRQPVSIIMLDLDDFKKINDLHGHEAGDFVLRSISSILLRNVRPNDVACRYGGEEFLLILPGASLNAARSRAELLREKIEGLNMRYRAGTVSAVTISAGVATYPETGREPGDLLRQADAALYRAKKQGRNRVVVAPNCELQDSAAG